MTATAPDREHTARVIAGVVAVVSGLVILAVATTPVAAWCGGFIAGSCMMRLLYLLDPSVGR